MVENSNRVHHFSEVGHGGAFIAMRRISEAIASIDFKSTYSSAVDDRVTRLNKRIGRKIDYEIQRISSAPSSISYFSSGMFSPKPFTKLIDTSSENLVTNFHWLPGRLSKDVDITKANNVFFTLHDMRIFTGVCHYSVNCLKYTNGCGGCPMVPKILSKLPEIDWKSRKDFFSMNSNYRFISPSRWLANRVVESGIISEKSITVIPNPILQSEYTDQAPDTDEIVIGLLGSEYSISKNSIEASQALETALKAHKSKVRIKFIGSAISGTYNAKSIESLPVGSSNDDVAKFISNCDLFIYASKMDNFPNIILECQSSGVRVVSYNSGGIPETLSIPESGIVTKPNISDLGKAIAEDLDNLTLIRGNRESIINSTIENQRTQRTRRNQKESKK